MPVDLSAREWDLLEALRDRKIPADIAREWGTSKQNIANIIASLAAKGVIVRGDDSRPWVMYSCGYPWTVPNDLDVRYQPAVPPAAELRARYATDSRTDRTVPPIRIVRWDEGGWTVQGIPACRPDGIIPSHASPDEVVVWCVRDGDRHPRSWAFEARRGLRWLESHTVEQFETRPSSKYRLRLTPTLRENLTLAIAAVIAVEPVLDITAPTRGVPVQRQEWTPGTQVPFVAPELP
jgi:MarR family protein